MSAEMSMNERIGLMPAGPLSLPAAFIADPFVSRIEGHVLDGYAPRTLAGLRAGWRAWCAACDEAGTDPLPVDERVLLSEIHRRVLAGQSRSTIETALLFPLRVAHKRAGLPSPTGSVLFADLWKKLCRERLRARQGQAQALSEWHLRELDGVLAIDRPRDCLLAAVCGLAYDALLRVSELVAIEQGHLARERDGSALLLLQRSKTDQEGQGAVLAIRAETMRWVDAHLAFALRRAPEGPWLFPSPHHDGRRAISTRQAANLILEAGRRIGVQGLSGHSGRVGAAQDMANAGASLPLMQRQGRWKSAKQPARYAEAADARTSAKARFDLIRQAGHKVPATGDAAGSGMADASTFAGLRSKA